MKSVQIRSFFWSLFSCIQSEKSSVFGHISCNVTNFILISELEKDHSMVETLRLKNVEFIILLYTFLVISFFRYNKYMICLILFSKFSDVLPAFAFGIAIGNL